MANKSIAEHRAVLFRCPRAARWPLVVDLGPDRYAASPGPAAAVAPARRVEPNPTRRIERFVAGVAWARAVEIEEPRVGACCAVGPAYGERFAAGDGWRKCRRERGGAQARTSSTSWVSIYIDMRRFLTLLALALFSLHAQDDSAAFIARVEAAQPNGKDLAALTLTELMQRVHVPGLSIAIVRDFEIHWTKAYGVADIETNRPVDAGTLFQAASISKPVAAMAALRLVEQHRLGLDDDINSILKSWHVPGHSVTPRSLMSHTSGSDDGSVFRDTIPRHRGPHWSRS